MSEKGIWLTFFHQTVVDKSKSSLQLFNIGLTFLCNVHFESIECLLRTSGCWCPSYSHSANEVVKLVFGAESQPHSCLCHTVSGCQVPPTDMHRRLPWESQGFLNSYQRVRLILTKNFCSTFCPFSIVLKESWHKSSQKNMKRER